MYKDQQYYVKAIISDAFEQYNAKRIYIENTDFKKIFKILKTDKDFSSIFSDVQDYISLIILYNVKEITKEEIGEHYRIKNQPILQSSNNNLIMFKYIEYPLNERAETFQQLFLTEDILSITEFNRCFINLIVKTYSEQLNKKVNNRVVNKKKEDLKYKCEKCKYYTNKKSDINTHLKSKQHIEYFVLDEKNLCELCKIEYIENGDIGLSLEQSIRFFDKFSLSIIAVDILGNIIFEHKNKYEHRYSPNTS